MFLSNGHLLLTVLVDRIPYRSLEEIVHVKKGSSEYGEVCFLHTSTGRGDVVTTGDHVTNYAAVSRMPHNKTPSTVLEHL